MIQRLRTDNTVRRGQWVALADVSPALRTALVMSEDKRFYEHSGVDWRDVSSAAWANLWNTKTPGTSTISMQLAGLLPDIPPQRVSFKAQGHNLRCLINGKPFSRGPEAQWLPWPGRHLVQLADSSGSVLDKVKIEVRGAGLKAASRAPSR